MTCENVACCGGSVRSTQLESEFTIRSRVGDDGVGGVPLVVRNCRRKPLRLITTRPGAAQSMVAEPLSPQHGMALHELPGTPPVADIQVALSEPDRYSAGQGCCGLP